MTDSHGAATPAPAAPAAPAPASIGPITWFRNLDIRQVAWTLGVMTMVEQAIAKGDIVLAGVPDAWVHIIQVWCGNLVLFNGFALFGHAQSAVKWPTPPAALKAVLAWLMVGALLCAFAMPAIAAEPKRPPLTGNLVNDIETATSNTTAKSATDIANALAKPFLDIANLITDDNGDAVKLSTEIAGLQDGNGQACWGAMKSFSDVVKAHPIPATFHVATDIEALRLLSMATNNVCKNSACSQVFTELANGIQQLEPANFSVPIPSLTSLCSKVPQIAVVPPTNAAVSTTAVVAPASK